MASIKKKFSGRKKCGTQSSRKNIRLDKIVTQSPFKRQTKDAQNPTREMS